MTEPSTSDLIEDACKGNPKALAELFERYEQLAVQTARRLLYPSLRRHLESGDVLQQLWLSILRAPYKLAGYQSLGGLLHAMIRNKIRYASRKARRSERRCDRATPVDLVIDPRTREGPLLGLVRRETVDRALESLRLRAAAAKNQEDRRRYQCDLEIIRLRVERVKLRDIADRLGLQSWMQVAHRVTSVSRYLTARGIRWPNE